MAFMNIAKANMSKRRRQRRPGAGKGEEGGGSGRVPPGPDAAAGDPDLVVNRHIGSGLRSLFQEVVDQPIPKKLLDLLEKLDRKEGKD